MLVRLVACAAGFLVFLAPLLAHARAPFTLDAAIQRVLATHPDLRVYASRLDVLKAHAQRAAQAPPLAVSGSVENAFGTGPVSGLGGAELTLSLASVLERGGKRAARQALAASQIDALAVSRAATELDVIAEVARRYLDVVAAQAQLVIAEQEIVLRTKIIEVAAARTRAGASPDAVRLAATALRTRAAIQRASTRHDIAAAWNRLALMWGEEAAQFATDPAESGANAPLVDMDVLKLPNLISFSEMQRTLERSPELRQFADQARIREARLQLASSAAAFDVDWSAGLRRLQDGSSWALVAGGSVALGARDRAQPAIRSALAEREALGIEREATLLTLNGTLAQAFGTFAAARSKVELITRDLLPQLSEAQALAQAAYRAGALSYLEWAQLQTETSHALRERLDAALAAHRALIEIQRLTAEPALALNSSGEAP